MVLQPADSAEGSRRTSHSGAEQLRDAPGPILQLDGLDASCCGQGGRRRTCGQRRHQVQSTSAQLEAEKLHQEAAEAPGTGREYPEAAEGDAKEGIWHVSEEPR